MLSKCGRSLVGFSKDKSLVLITEMEAPVSKSAVVLCLSRRTEINNGSDEVILQIKSLPPEPSHIESHSSKSRSACATKEIDECRGEKVVSSQFSTSGFFGGRSN